MYIGCTSDVFKCSHIYVQFVELIDDFVNFTYPYNATAAELANFTTEIEKSPNESVLQVNIKGCGYPPKIQCKNFTEKYGYEGAIYPCFYSQKNKTVVMTSYNRDDQVTTIIHFFIVPFIVSIIASIGLCVMHCNCKCKKERPKYRRPRVENLRWVIFHVDILCFFSFILSFFYLVDYMTFFIVLFVSFAKLLCFFF